MTDNSRYKSGLFGEKLALEKMEKLGFQLVKTRYKTKYGEIDLIGLKIKKNIKIIT